MICLNGPKGMGLDLQRQLFEVALDEIEALGSDRISKRPEATAEGDAETIVVLLYDLPGV